MLIPFPFTSLPMHSLSSSVSGQVSGGSPIEYQADEQAGVERLSWRLPGR